MTTKSDTLDLLVTITDNALADADVNYDLARDIRTLASSRVTRAAQLHGPAERLEALDELVAAIRSEALALFARQDSRREAEAARKARFELL